MENLTDENGIQQARNSARRAAAKGERAAEAVADEAGSTVDDLKELGGQAADRLRSAGENAYEEISEAVEEGKEEGTSIINAVVSTAKDAANGAWEVTKNEIERKPLQSVAIALAAGVILGGLLSSRD